ncbi:MAG: glycosyltransferase family 4 protein [Sphingopyxis sp.]
MTKPPLHICIVTSEVVGPFKNGGIGTSMTGLAQCLADQGHRVTLLFTASKGFSSHDKQWWTERYQTIGIDLLWLDHHGAALVAGPLGECGFATPYLVYQAVAQIGADIVQFNDCMGEGLYTLAMHALGQGKAGQRMVLALHSPTEWIWAINRNLPQTMLHAAFSHAERLSVATCDQLWSPSRYLLDWVRERGFAVANSAIVQQYALPKLPLIGGDWAEEIVDEVCAPQPVREVVFFGRIEERKGIKLFCEALTLIEPTLVELGVSVTFLGKENTVGDQLAFDYLDQQSSQWLFPTRRISDLGQQEAIYYIRARSALAVMASPADNSPCTVYEALAFGLSFIAARTGGIAELIAEADHANVLFDYRADAMTERLRAALSVGIAPARAAQPQAQVRAVWGALFGQWAAQSSVKRAQPPCRPLAIVIDHPPGRDLAATLASCAGVDAAHIIIVDRAGDAQSLAQKDAAIIVWTVDDCAAQLGQLWGHDAVLVRSGMRLLPEQMPALRAAMQAGAAEMLMPFAWVGEGESERMVTTLGASASFCFFAGAMHAGVMAAGGEAIQRALKGRALVHEMEFFGLPDLLVTAGLTCLPYPQAVAHHGTALIAEQGNRRTRERIAAYAAVDGVERFYLTALAEGRAAGIVGSRRLRRARQWLDAHGLGWVGALARRGRPRAVLMALFGRRPV